MSCALAGWEVRSGVTRVISRPCSLCSSYWTLGSTGGVCSEAQTAAVHVSKGLETSPALRAELLLGRPVQMPVPLLLRKVRERRGGGGDPSRRAHSQPALSRRGLFKGIEVLIPFVGMEFSVLPNFTICVRRNARKVS